MIRSYHQQRTHSQKRRSLFSGRRILGVPVRRNLTSSTWGGGWDSRGHLAAVRAALGSLTLSGKVTVESFPVASSSSDMATFCPSRHQLEAESMTHRGCFPWAAHIMASLEVERSQRLMRISFSCMSTLRKKEELLPVCEHQQTVFLGTY